MEVFHHLARNTYPLNTGGELFLATNLQQVLQQRQTIQCTDHYPLGTLSPQGMHFLAPPMNKFLLRLQSQGGERENTTVCLWLEL